MSLSPFVTTHPEMLSSAAGDLAGIGAAMSAANVGAAAPTGGVVPAAADEVSALTAAQFAAHAGHYQAVSAAAADSSVASEHPADQRDVLCGHRSGQRDRGRLSKHNSKKER